MRVITSDTLNTPYPYKCPERCKVGALVNKIRTIKSPIWGEYRDYVVYEIVSIHWFDPIEAKGIWGLADLRPKGTIGNKTASEYICDIMEVKYKVWADSESDVSVPEELVNTYFKTQEDATNKASELAHQHDNKNYRAIFHVEQIGLEEETVETFENILLN